jgi:hypothetical protein
MPATDATGMPIKTILTMIMAVALITIAVPLKAQEALRWTGLAELDRASRSYVKLDEEESVDSIRVATARLRESTPSGQKDALVVFHENSFSCGSAGCLLEVFLQQKSGGMAKVLDVNVSEVSLGKSYTKGVRNLRFNDGATTWVWTGKTFDLK